MIIISWTKIMILFNMGIIELQKSVSAAWHNRNGEY